MAADVKFSINKAAADQFLIPATVSEELEKKFLKKAKSSSIKLIPVSFLVSAVVLGILFVLVYFLKRIFISFMAIFCVFFPIYAIYDAFATGKAIKKHDYEFFYGEVVGKTDNGNYQIKGLEEHNISAMLGKKDYNAGDRVIVARIKDDLNLISED